MANELGRCVVTVKAQKTFDDLKALWAAPDDGAACSNPDCPNLHRIHILAESITINNLIVAGDLPAELKRALASKLAA